MQHRLVTNHTTHPLKGNNITIAKTIRLTAILLTPFVFSSSAKAALVEFAITGTGANGTVASGSFTTDDSGGNIYAPGYFAPGGIWSSLSLTLSNIPGEGPAAVTLSGNDELGATWLTVDGSGAQFIGPYGGHNYGPPDQHHYDLGQPSHAFYPASYIFQSALYYDGNGSAVHQKDLITWTPASIVPEPGSVFLTLAGLAIVAGGLRRAQCEPENA